MDLVIKNMKHEVLVEGETTSLKISVELVKNLIGTSLKYRMLFLDIELPAMLMTSHRYSHK